MEEKLRNFLKAIKLNESAISMGLGIVVVVVIGALVMNYFRLKPARLPQVTQEALQTSDVAKSEEFANTPAAELPPFTGELPTTYKVRAGDNLWKISERFYQSGYAWVEIATANNLPGSSLIEKDQELTIPQLAKAYPVTVGNDQPAIGGSNATGEATPSAALTPSPSLSDASTPTATTDIPLSIFRPTATPEQGKLTTENRFGGPISGDTYTVVKGDHLWGISTRTYNSGYKWVDLAKINNIQNPDLILPGMQLNLPR